MEVMMERANGSQNILGEGEIVKIKKFLNLSVDPSFVDLRQPLQSSLHF